MVYGYIRVSTDHQDCENQKLGIEAKAKSLNLHIDKLKFGDIIICSELSRLGRKLFMIMRILEHCMNVGARVYTVKDGYELGDNIQSKVMAFAFGLSAEIERDLISQRTKEALAVRRANGQKLGRPQGHTNKSHKLDGKMPLIIKMLDKGISKRRIAKQLRVSTPTLYDYLENNSKTEITSV